MFDYYSPNRCCGWVGNKTVYCTKLFIVLVKFCLKVIFLSYFNLDKHKTFCSHSKCIYAFSKHWLNLFWHIFHFSVLIAITPKPRKQISCRLKMSVEYGQTIIKKSNQTNILLIKALMITLGLFSDCPWSITESPRYKDSFYSLRLPLKQICCHREYQHAAIKKILKDFIWAVYTVRQF